MTPERLYQAIDATWPAAKIWRDGPWTHRDGAGGGSRVSATTLDGPFDQLPDRPLFMVKSGQDMLDQHLDAAGYLIKDPVTLYSCPIDTFAQEPPAVSTFAIWEPLAIMREIRAAGGIGPERLAIMHRAHHPKTAILGRLAGKPAATAFVAIDGDLAMLHALEVAAPHRRGGMGRYMMQRAAIWAKFSGAKHIAVLVTKENMGANRLYQSLGMMPTASYHYRIKGEII
ncbi:N-acetyltransferase [Nereida sp. MMG025]|uniref:GNAT family N-acetyltransferase n=1 Tax=Nereida sp. MMG025 TaxID=2909981 RepID=UPI001F262215|nr:GNAT family N-acetyltransferase [Nereida sp. MMG025]MCF6444435.1 GNAT family N-acetyltransferase [Nereida sp. MMG025]